MLQNTAKNEATSVGTRGKVVKLLALFSILSVLSLSPLAPAASPEKWFLFERVYRHRIEKLSQPMYRINPRLCGLEGEIGRIAPGAYADLVVTEVDPLNDLAALADSEKALVAIIARGRPVRNRLGD